MERSATFAHDGRHRLELGRRWGEGAPVVWVLLNPSAADATRDDPTIRRCIGFSRAWGFPAMTVVNLFSLCSADPRALDRDEVAEADANADVVARTVAGAPVAVVAWGRIGARRAARSRARAVLAERTSGYCCLGVNGDGSPRHPLYVPAATGLQIWHEPVPRREQSSR